MNKKILMSGIAALLIGGSMHATSVSASAISVSHSGEATLTATFSDTCKAAASDLTTNASALGVGDDTFTGTTATQADDVAGNRGALADFLLMTYTPDADAATEQSDGGVANAFSVDQFEDALDAINGLTNTVSVNDSALTGDVTFVADPCGGDSADNPVWATTSKLEFGASGTLANGLGVSVDLGAGAAGGAGSEIALSGAFGKIAWKDGGDSAVKMALPNAQGDLTVASRDDLGGHSVATSGTAGYVVGFTAPSVGGMDLFVTYAPSSGNSAVNDDAYLDTIAIGAKMSAGDITIGAGWESASYNSNASSAAGCIASGATMDIDGDPTLVVSGSVVPVSLGATADAILGGDLCGDQSLMGIGASMALADMTINAGYTKLDTDESDKTTYNVGLSTSVGEYTLGLDYVNSSKSYILASTTSHDQTVIGASLGTNLGDGVDLTLGFTSSSVDVADTGAHSNYNAEVELKITY